MNLKDKPIAVLIADVHYNITTLPIADEAMRQAVDKANVLDVPLIVAGDLHDTKALMRGECVKAILDTLGKAAKAPIVLVGNHCRINEKSPEHSLEFLKYSCDVVDVPTYRADLDLWLLPYYSDSQMLSYELSDIPRGSLVICHQGVIGADMGHYVQDRTSLPIEAFKGLKVRSGHYHKAQSVPGGDFQYIGNPYSLTFGEAEDGPKGFQVLYRNGSMKQVPTNLRKHVILNASTGDLKSLPPQDPNDLVWLKVSGPHSELQALNKQAIGDALLGHANFKLDKIYTDLPKLIEKTDLLTDAETLDKLIEATSESQEKKAELKALWKTLV